MGSAKRERRTGVHALPAGTTMHRYVKFVPKATELKFRLMQGPELTWTHLAYKNGELICRERLDQGSVEAAYLIATAEGRNIRNGEMPDTVGLFEFCDDGAMV